MELKVNNKKIDFFNKVAVNLQYDSVASDFGFDFLFDPNNPEHKELARPLQYKNATLTHNNETIITGTVLSHGFSSRSVKQPAALSGYSLPGVLEDCQIPLSTYPLQYNNLSLKQIIEKLIKPFGLKLEIDASVAARANAVYSTITANESDTVKEFITNLAAHKKIIVTHNAAGHLYLTEAKTNVSPIIKFHGQTPYEAMRLSVNGQQMNSEIHAIKQASVKHPNAGQANKKNPLVGAYRPKTIQQTKGTDNDTEYVADKALNNQLRNIKLTIELTTWVVDGKILRPNNTVSVVEPELYLYNPATFFIESVALEGDNVAQKATLTCVPPEAYTHLTPKNMFA